MPASGNWPLSHSMVHGADGPSRMPRMRHNVAAGANVRLNKACPVQSTRFFKAKSQEEGKNCPNCGTLATQIRDEASTSRKARASSASHTAGVFKNSALTFPVIVPMCVITCNTDNGESQDMRVKLLCDPCAHRHRMRRISGARQKVP